MISKNEILSTFDHMQPEFSAAPELIPVFLTKSLSQAAERQQKLEMDYAASMVGLCALLPGKLEIVEEIGEDSYETTWIKGGVTIGRTARYQHNKPGDAFNTSTEFVLTRAGVALIDQASPDPEVANAAPALVTANGGKAVL